MNNIRILKPEFVKLIPTAIIISHDFKSLEVDVLKDIIKGRVEVTHSMFPQTKTVMTDTFSFCTTINNWNRGVLDFMYCFK